MAMKFEGRDRAFSSTLRDGEQVVNASAFHMRIHATTIEEPVVIKKSGWTVMFLIWITPVALGLAFLRMAWELGGNTAPWMWLLLGCHVAGTLLAVVLLLRKTFFSLLSLDDEKIVVENGAKKTIIPWKDLRKTELIEKTKKIRQRDVTYHILRLVTADKTEVDVSLNFGKATLTKVDEAFEAKGFDVTDCVKTTARHNAAVVWLPALIGIPNYIAVSGFIVWYFLYP
jgi:hypothetical protein|tara:strand:- start:8 stop:691 length:684 start_codon:yes stop_codon:yes gene_type:complete